MARIDIDDGTVANDGTGDTLRDTAQNLNVMLAELYARVTGDSDGNNKAPLLLTEERAGGAGIYELADAVPTDDAHFYFNTTGKSDGLDRKVSGAGMKSYIGGVSSGLDVRTEAEDVDGHTYTNSAANPPNSFISGLGIDDLVTGTYLFEAELNYEVLPGGADSPGIRLALHAASGSLVVSSHFGQVTLIHQGDDPRCGLISNGFNSATLSAGFGVDLPVGIGVARLSGHMVVATGGDIRLAAAQNTASSDNSLFFPVGSGWMRVTRLT